MADAPRGHIERLPSGSFRVDVYGGTDPLTRRRIRFRKTCKDEVTAQIQLGKFLAQAQAGKHAESTATVGQLLDQYLLVGDWDLATREGYEGYIRRTIRPALGHVQARKVRGPMLDMLYARLRRCGDLAARALFERSPFDFERWAVSRINAQPNEKQVADRGIDGVARFYLDKKATGRVLVSVKGGKHVGPAFVRDLLGTVETRRGQMGVLITMAEPPRGVIDAANHGGVYRWPVNGQTFPRLQVITVADLLAGRRPSMPQLMLPYVTTPKALPESLQMELFGKAASA